MRTNPQVACYEGQSSWRRLVPSRSHGRSGVLSLGLLLAVVLGAGCASSTAKGAGGKELTLVRPAHQTLRRGETNRVDIMLMRENIPQDVALKFTDLPKGVKVVEADRKVKADELVVTYTLFAANDADLVSNHVAKVTAEGPSGLRATESLAMTIKQ